MKIEAILRIILPYLLGTKMDPLLKTEKLKNTCRYYVEKGLDKTEG